VSATSSGCVGNTTPCFSKNSLSRSLTIGHTLLLIRGAQVRFLPGAPLKNCSKPTIFSPLPFASEAFPLKSGGHIGGESSYNNHNLLFLHNFRGKPPLTLSFGHTKSKALTITHWNITL
jgi:hypothetical protein